MCQLASAPIFSPIVSDFYSGMVVTVPLFKQMLCAGKTVENIKAVYQDKYQGPLVRYVEQLDANGFLSGKALYQKDSMQIGVNGNEERILLLAAYDNLGKGASGAAVECMNMVIGAERTTGLVL